MKKYDIPKIEIKHFLNRILVASSGAPQKSYIDEVGILGAVLTGNSVEHQKRMESFSKLLEFKQ